MDHSFRVTVPFTVLLVLFSLMIFALFELGKHTVFGWILLALTIAAYFVLRGKYLVHLSFWWRLLGFSGFLAAVLIVAKLSMPPVRAIPAVSFKDPSPTGVVTVAQGQLRGVYNEDGSVEVYAGIPYAKPPVGDLRWREPQPPEPWQGVRVCDTFAPMSMQPRTNTIYASLSDIVGFHTFRITTEDNFIPPMSEDSLYLNVWKPAGEVSGLPVLVFIHGGSLTTGQPWYDQYNGEAIARHGVVVVNFAYRLGIFGYYANEALAAESPNGTTGNYGFLDQIQALKWVRENISAFGGDPARVTVAGESAGASSVGALCVSPLSEGLFRYAIAESSGITAKVPYHTFRSMEDALKTGSAILEEFHAASVDALRAVPAEELVGTRHSNAEMTVDGWAITEQPYLTYEKGNNHETALLQGYNVHEADFFVMGTKVTAESYAEALKPLYGEYAEQAAALMPPRAQDSYYKQIIDAGGDAKGSFDEAVSTAWFSYSHYRWARLLGNRGTPVYTYYFTKDNRGLGSNHAGELPYFYGCLETHPKNYDESDIRLSEQMLHYYVNFIKTGDPNGLFLPRWASFAEAPQQVLELGAEIRMIEDPHLELHRLLDLHQDSLE